MNRFFAIALAALALALPASAKSACRDFRVQVEKPTEPAVAADSRVIAVDEEHVPTFEFHERSRGGTFAVKGMLCGIDLVPLADRRVQLVRFERAGSAGPLTRADLGRQTRRQTYDAVSSADGRFTVSGLPAGEYWIDTDWTELPAVVYDLRLIPGPATFSPLSQIGFLQPNR